MRAASKVAIVACLALAGLIAYTVTTRAQDATKDAMMTFAFDLHEGVKRSTLTPQQKEQVRNDLQSMRQAHQNGDRRGAMQAMMNFHQLLDSGAFQPQDQQRIKQDLQNLRAAKQAGGGGMGGGGMGMGMGGMR